MEKAAVATLVPRGHTSDVLQPAIWIQAAPETQRLRKTVASVPQVDLSPEPAGLYPLPCSTGTLHTPSQAHPHWVRLRLGLTFQAEEFTE